MWPKENYKLKQLETAWFHKKQITVQYLPHLTEAQERRLLVILQYSI